MVLRLCHRKLTVTRRLCFCARAFTPACEREHRRRCGVVPECSGVARCWLTTGCSCMRVRSTFPSMASLVTSSRIPPGPRTKKELTRVRAWMRCHVPARGASSVPCRNARTFLRVPSPCAVAAAILDWGMAEGATNFSHVFQPLGSIGVRHGCTGAPQTALHVRRRRRARVQFQGRAASARRDGRLLVPKRRPAQ